MAWCHRALRHYLRLCWPISTVYPKKYAHGFCFAVLCCCYTLPDFPISIKLTSLALWQSNDCPSASKATLMIMDKYFTWIHYERLHNHNKAKHNKTVCIFLGIYSVYPYDVNTPQWVNLWGIPHVLCKYTLPYRQAPLKLSTGTKSSITPSLPNIWFYLKTPTPSKTELYTADYDLRF